MLVVNAVIALAVQHTVASAFLVSQLAGIEASGCNALRLC